MPTLGELYNLLVADTETKRVGVKLKPYITGSFSFFNHLGEILTWTTFYTTNTKNTKALNRVE